MKRQSNQVQLNRLAEQIGKFIEYWGFKKIHGMIWTHLYVSPHPLSAQELIQRLRVSKALVSLSIKDLLHFELILQTEESLNKKNKFYTANPDVFTVIRKVLETREKEMLKKIGAEFKALQALKEEAGTSSLLDPERIAALELMINGADAALENLLHLSKMDPSFLHSFLTPLK